MEQTRQGHTAGPWTVGNSDNGRCCVWLAGNTEPHFGMGPDALWIDCNTEENANLVAAAPELLEALEIALKSVRSDDVSNAPMPEAYARLALGWIRAKFEDKAAAAIAKAKGESA